MKRHNGPAIIRRSLAWRALDEPAKQGPIHRRRTVRASELGSFGFCPQAHRIETQRTVLASQDGAPFAGTPGGRPIPPFQSDEMQWDSPALHRGRQAHDRLARRSKQSTGAWGARVALVICMLAVAADLIAKFGFD